MWHHIQYACYHNKCLGHYTPLHITSHPVYLWHHIQYVCYHRTAFMTIQWQYRTSHPPYLTSQPLYQCLHTEGTHICINVWLYQWHQNKCVTDHTWHTYDIIPNLHPIIFTLYDIHDHVLWHHIHGIHDIRSPLNDIHPLFRTAHHFMYDIKSTVSDIKSTVSVSSHPPYRWHHSHYKEGITSSTCVISYPLCFWQNIH